MKSVCSNKICFSYSVCILLNRVIDCGKEPSLFSISYVAMWNFDLMWPPTTHPPTHHPPPLILSLCLCLNMKCYIWAGVKLRHFDVKVWGLSGSQVLLCLYWFHLLWHCSASRSAGKDTTVAVHIESTAQPRKLCSSFHKVLMIQPTKQGLYLRITCGKSAVSLLESCMNVISSQSINRILFRIVQTPPPHPSSAERTAWPTLTWRGTGCRWPVTHSRHVGIPAASLTWSGHGGGQTETPSGAPATLLLPSVGRGDNRRNVTCRASNTFTRVKSQTREVSWILNVFCEWTHLALWLSII